MYQQVRSSFKVVSFMAFSALALFLTGCQEAPEACFQTDTALVDMNSEVDFSNCTDPIAEGYLWNFGDGSTSTEVNPTHTFTSEGQFLVSLESQAKNEANNNIYKTLIKVGQRVVQSIQLDNLPTENPTGGAWDAGSNPDLSMKFWRDSVLVYQSPTVNDPFWGFPMTITIPASDLVLSPTNWKFQVVDVDGSSEEVMSEFPVSFNTLTPNVSREVQVVDSAGEFRLVYFLR
jgi:PKD repeat protein